MKWFDQHQLGSPGHVEIALQQTGLLRSRLSACEMLKLIFEHPHFFIAPPRNFPTLYSWALHCSSYLGFGVTVKHPPPPIDQSMGVAHAVHPVSFGLRVRTYRMSAERWIVGTPLQQHTYISGNIPHGVHEQIILQVEHTRSDVCDAPEMSSSSSPSSAYSICSQPADGQSSWICKLLRMT